MRLITNREGYAKHAAPESIEAYIKKARANLTRAQEEYNWLRELWFDRQDQIREGTWPSRNP